MEAKTESRASGISTFGSRVATGGLLLYAAFAPHSIAAAEISLAIAGAGWLLRTVTTGTTGFRRTRFDLPIWLFFLWTVLSAFLSEEPRISIAKIQSTCVIFLFYLTQAIATRRTAVWLVVLVIVSGCAGTVYSVYDLARGRGVVVESITPNSPLIAAKIQPGDAIWRVAGKRVYSVADIDETLRNIPANLPVTISVISSGEHVERPGVTVSDRVKALSSPSGVTGDRASHRFRASGWTRHYETYAEILQMVAQLALGFALAHLLNHGFNRRSQLALLATAVLAVGLALTAMRTCLIAFAVAAAVISFRALRGRARLVTVGGIAIVLLIGAFVIYQTRAQRALSLGDPSSSMRIGVAKAGASRIMLHPLFGHGMDAAHLHWNEWGFPGTDLEHLHSTPLQLAFDRGLPAVVIWFWILFVAWQTLSRGERSARDTRDTNRLALMIGITGALIGFFVSSLVNYNLGDGEVALLFWWLMGLTVVVSDAATIKEARNQ